MRIVIESLTAFGKFIVKFEKLEPSDHRVEYFAIAVDGEKAARVSKDKWIGIYSAALEYAIHGYSSGKGIKA